MLSLLIIPVLYLKYGVCDQMDSSRLDRSPIDVHTMKKAVYHLDDRAKPTMKSNDYVSPHLIPIDVLDSHHVTKKEVYKLASRSSSEAIEKSTKKGFEIDDPDLRPTEKSLGEKLEKKSYDYDLDYDQMVKKPSYHFEENQPDHGQIFRKKQSFFMDNVDRRKKPYYTTDSTLDTTQKPHVKKLFNRKKYTDLDNQFESDEKDEINIDVGGSQNPSLEEFLNNYAQKVKHEKYGEKDDYSNDIKASKGKKSWSLLNSKHHNHPYDDRKGWVSLEPIPWTVSKVSKWQSKYKPTEKPAWHSRPWLDYPETNSAQEDGYKYPTVNSLIDKKKYQVYYMQNNEQNPEPIYHKPTYGHVSNSHNSYNDDYLQEADCDHRHQNRPHKYNNVRPLHHAYDRDHEPHSLITDGLPANFPRQPHGPSRRLGVPLGASSGEEPASQEGEWVLLSTTKGYKVPSGGRSGRQLTDLAVVSQPQRGDRVDIGESKMGLIDLSA
ncbi:unnamed protein product [Callosobruchus maculatus]|uniref:Zasp-like motif domain-containing protein n=1 Tax=Callosobruchus maculatus TaxID=64391 RepID=A0A653CSC1_CALMS|nr:unnamed protein product [Callosobruchus maculatus]